MWVLQVRLNLLTQATGRGSAAGVGAETWPEPPRGTGLGLRLRHVPALLPAVPGRDACGLAGDRDACGLAGGSPGCRKGFLNKPAKNKHTVLESSGRGFIQHSPYVLNKAIHVARVCDLDGKFFNFYF